MSKDDEENLYLLTTELKSVYTNATVNDEAKKQTLGQVLYHLEMLYLDILDARLLVYSPDNDGRIFHFIAQRKKMLEQLEKKATYDSEEYNEIRWAMIDLDQLSDHHAYTDPYRSTRYQWRKDNTKQTWARFGIHYYLSNKTNKQGPPEPATIRKGKMCSFSADRHPLMTLTLAKTYHLLRSLNIKAHRTESAGTAKANKPTFKNKQAANELYWKATTNIVFGYLPAVFQSKPGKYDYEPMSRRVHKVYTDLRKKKLSPFLARLIGKFLEKWPA